MYGNATSLYFNRLLTYFPYVRNFKDKRKITSLLDLFSFNKSTPSSKEVASRNTVVFDIFVASIKSFIDISCFSAKQSSMLIAFKRLLLTYTTPFSSLYTPYVA